VKQSASASMLWITPSKASALKGVPAPGKGTEGDSACSSNGRQVIEFASSFLATNAGSQQSGVAQARMGACVDYFPIRSAVPDSLAGRHPRLHFRGLLGLHSCYGPPGCSTAQGGLCHEASIRPVCPAKPLVSYQTY
jgi:hypothetical protein